MYFQDFLNQHSRTLIMGILNMTPDSFYDGNKYLDRNSLVEKFKKLYKTDIIDVGAESSRPGSTPISEQEEISRISNMFDFLKNKDTFYSIDTYKPKVAKKAIEKGFNMINDITGGKNLDMLKVASEFNVPIILMHMKGNPKNMQENPKYNNIIDDLIFYFEKRIEAAIDHGVNKKQIIIDPGIGFGKTIYHNDIIIRNLSKLKIFNLPILVGISRKSFLSYNSNNPSDRLGSSLAVSSIAINNGADIIRVHDIEESIKVFSIIDRLINK